MIGVGMTDYLNRKQKQLGETVSQVTGQPAPTGANPAWGAEFNSNKAPATMGQPAPATPPDQPFQSTAGSNVKAYIDRTSSTLGQDPGAISEAGKLYTDRVTNGLKTPDPSSVNAQNTQDTAAARRAYLARVQADEAIGQSGFGQGTAQADRIRMNSVAGVNEANQAGQNSVNAYLRQRTEDNMNRARDLETQQYGRNRQILGDAQDQDLTEYNRSERSKDRNIAAAATEYSHGRDAIGDKRYKSETEYSHSRDAIGDKRYDSEFAYKQSRDAVGDSHWETSHTDQVAQQAFENSRVLAGADETAKRNLLAGLPEGPAKNKVMAGLADGSLTLQTALGAVFNSDGSIKDEYRGKTPGALGLEAEQEYAAQTVDMEFPGLKNTNPQEYLAKVQAEMLANRKAQTGPVNDAKVAQTSDDIVKKIRAGETLSGEDLSTAIRENLIPSATTSTDSFINGSQEVSAYLREHPDGNMIMDGALVKVVSGGRFASGDGHTNYTQVKYGGTDYWVDSHGYWYNRNPKTIGNPNTMKPGKGAIPSPLKG